MEDNEVVFLGARTLQGLLIKANGPDEGQLGIMFTYRSHYPNKTTPQYVLGTTKKARPTESKTPEDRCLIKSIPHRDKNIETKKSVEK